MNNLKKRFFKDIMYTNVGTILISVNPFQFLPLYEMLRGGGSRRAAAGWRAVAGGRGRAGGRAAGGRIGGELCAGYPLPRVLQVY